MNSISLRLSEIALEILRERYLRRDEAGKLVETPEGMLNRVAGAIAEPARSFGEDTPFWQARFIERMRRRNGAASDQGIRLGKARYRTVGRLAPAFPHRPGDHPAVSLAHAGGVSGSCRRRRFEDGESAA
jgi:Ribonucleotide reductase, all-alpha domain